jgi:hypothetical protein
MGLAEFASMTMIVAIVIILIICLGVYWLLGSTASVIVGLGLFILATPLFLIGGMASALASKPTTSQ